MASYLCLQSIQDLHKNLMKAKLNWESRFEMMLPSKPYLHPVITNSPALYSFCPLLIFT